MSIAHERWGEDFFAQVPDTFWTEYVVLIQEFPNLDIQAGIFAALADRAHCR